MTDIQATSGCSQLERLEKFVTLRNEIATRYDILLKEIDVQCPIIDSDNDSAYHLYPIQVRIDLYLSFCVPVIGVNVHYIPIHLQPFYRKKAFHPAIFQIRKILFTCYIYPSISWLKSQHQDKIVSAIREVC